MRLEFFKAHHRITPDEKVPVALDYRNFPKFGGCPLIFVQRLKLSTSNLVHSLGLPRPIIKSNREKKWAWPWARGTPPKFWVSYNISVTAEGSDFKFGTQLTFAKNHNKIKRMSKGGVALNCGAPKNLEFFSIFAQ